MAKKSTVTDETINIAELKRASIKLRIIGTTPMFQNRMSAKAQQELLVGGSGKTKASKAQIKHHPLAEFRRAAETMPAGPTGLGLRVVAVKSAMCTAALETAGITKTGAQRLIFMPGELTPLYGTPQIRLDVVRNSDPGRTPDVRSRVFLPRWGAEIEVQFITPQFGAAAIVTLLANAGILIGLGDFRQEKGKGSFGLFRVLGEGDRDAEWDDLVKNHGRRAQLEALDNPERANDETAELMEFWEQEFRRRSA